MIKKYIILVLRLAIAFFFIWAAHSKITNAAAFSSAIRAYDIIPNTLSTIPAIFLPWIELYAAVFLMVGFYTRSAAFIIMILTAVFTIFVFIALLRGLQIDCGCGASVAGIDEVSWLKILENMVIFAVTLILVNTKSFFLSVDSLRSD